jgi:hypothetical protein
MLLKAKTFDSPESFFASIPRELKQNIQFRKVLHEILEKDTSLQKLFLQMMLAEPRIFFNAVTWTVNPRMPAGKRNFPFILRPKQEEVVRVLHDCIINQNDMGINKSRDEGATEIVTKMFALMSLIPESYFIVGSRNQELVDSRGDPYTLMAKIDYAFETMPPWMKAVIEYIPMTDRKEMQLILPKVNSVIKGETTNESFSAGRRATAIFLDEFGRVEPRVAESIEGSVHDVSGCVIYGSTHWFGENHPFNKALKKSTTKVVNLLWFDNPVKAAGLYKSPDYDVIEIVDKAYYLEQYPQIFQSRPELLEKPFKLSEVEKDLLLTMVSIGSTPKFIADKCESLPPGADMRSPWHDFEFERRAGNYRDFVSNVWGSPIGAQDSVFSTITLARMEKGLKSPVFKGEISFSDEDGKIVNVGISPGGRNRLLLWKLKDPTHNYVIGCDPSLGTGNSNSVAYIYDVNTCEAVGTWVCPNTPYEHFADTVVALARFFNEAFVIFENNGGHGVNFGRRLQKRGYYRVYTQHTEDTKTKRLQNKLGWSSNPNSKSDLLGELGIALSEGLKTNPKFSSCIIFDQSTLDELRSYVFYENGDIGCSEEQDIKSGARKRHGDRVIALGLCILGSKYQAKAPKKEEKKVNIDSFAYRKEQMDTQREQMAGHNRIYRF